MAESAEIDRVSMIVLRAMRGPLMLLITVYAIGMAGFGLLPDANGEHMSFMHALYFMSYTATTTGFGELPQPFSESQRLWAIVVLHISVISWLYSIGSILRLLQNEHFRRAVSQHVFARRVRKLDSPFAIVSGFGDTGSLLARSLDVLRIPVVVIDPDPDRIKALKLRNTDVVLLGVCADGSDPRQLLNAGLRHPRCGFVIAVADDEYVNMKTCIMSRQLNPALTPICRQDTREFCSDLETFGSVTVLDSFEIFADGVCLALQRPLLHGLGDWLLRVPGANLNVRDECPAGTWIVCGYGRMGHRLEENLRTVGIRLIVIDPDIPEEEVSETRIRGSANHDTLAQAGIEEAACVVVGTNSDTVNIRVLMLVRRLRKDVFIVVRQNHHSNEVAFVDAPVDVIMHPDRLMARRIERELISPTLQPLLDHLRDRPIEELQSLVKRLQLAIGDDAPRLWVQHLDQSSAPAVAEWLDDEDREGCRLGDLLRDPGNRHATLPVVPLVLQREDELIRLPELDTALAVNDRLLLCAAAGVRASLDTTTDDQARLEYLITGREPPRGTLFRWLDQNRDQSEVPEV